MPQNPRVLSLGLSGIQVILPVPMILGQHIHKGAVLIVVDAGRQPVVIRMVDGDIFEPRCRIEDTGDGGALKRRFRLADRNITRKDITTYAPFFPDKAMRTLIESEVIYSVAQ